MYNRDMNTIKNNFKALFLEHQKKENRLISKTEAAKAMGITRTTLDKWLEGEVGKFDADVLVKVCDYFNVPLSQLLEYQPDESIK
jgi:DNA-binding Xre family transcriptional regulator